MWLKTLTEADNESFHVLSQTLIAHLESNVTLLLIRQKLEELRQLLVQTFADYFYVNISFCFRLNLHVPKSEWLYRFARGLRPEIHDHGILQQPTDADSALNFARLKELVTLVNRITVKKLKNFRS